MRASGPSGPLVITVVNTGVSSLILFNNNRLSHPVAVAI